MAKFHNCKNCRNKFKHQTGRKAHNKFCSRLCSALDYGKSFKKENSPHWIGGMQRTKNCLLCNKEIRNVPKKEITTLKKLYPNVVFTCRAIGSFQKQKFCSSECSETGRIYKKGSEHGNWTGGRSTLRQLVSATYKHKVWHETVFIRDNYTCQICRKHGGYLEVDYFPKSFIEIIRECN